MKKLIFSGGLVIALTFGLTTGLNSQVSQIGAGLIGSKAKCHHNATDSDGSITDFCNNSVCTSQDGKTGNNFSKCG